MISKPVLAWSGGEEKKKKKRPNSYRWSPFADIQNGQQQNYSYFM